MTDPSLLTELVHAVAILTALVIMLLVVAYQIVDDYRHRPTKRTEHLKRTLLEMEETSSILTREPDTNFTEST